MSFEYGDGIGYLNKATGFLRAYQNALVFNPNIAANLRHEAETSLYLAEKFGMNTQEQRRVIHFFDKK